ncbi:MAG: hypothetical protein P8M34_09780 [Saprospiraceae bacterium]|nr:hypothetical protein [Saprospiraceae bacterium]
MILDYTIFGERNSGTNYLRKVLQENVNLPFTQVYGFKHWYIKGLVPRGQDNTTTDNECLKSIEHGSHTLFIHIVRNPFDWSAAMYKKPYHICESDRTSLLNFLRSPYMAYEKNQPPNHTVEFKSPWIRDPHTGYFFIEKSANLITLRNEKNLHFEMLERKVKYFSIIRLENLKSDVSDMIDQFDLPTKNTKEIVLNEFRQPEEYTISEEVKVFIKDQLGNPIDEKLYLKMQ